MAILYTGVLSHPADACAAPDCAHRAMQDAGGRLHPLGDGRYLVLDPPAPRQALRPQHSPAQSGAQGDCLRPGCWCRHVAGYAYHCAACDDASDIAYVCLEQPGVCVRCCRHEPCQARWDALVAGARPEDF